MNWPPPENLAGPASMLLSINEAVYDEYMQAAFENYDQRRQDLHLAGFSERFESHGGFSFPAFPFGQHG